MNKEKLEAWIKESADKQEEPYGDIVYTDGARSMIPLVLRLHGALLEIASWCIENDHNKCMIAECKIARDALADADKMIGGE